MFSKIPVTSGLNFSISKPKNDAPEKDLKPQLKPWEIFDWPPEREHAMYREWGMHCSRKQQPDKAETYFRRALEMDSNDGSTLHQRSKCNRQLARNLSAFDDSMKATHYDPLQPNYDLEYCQCLYELNEFEVSKVKASEKSHNYARSKRKQFTDLIETIDENILDSCGDSVKTLLLKKPNFSEVVSAYHLKSFEDPRPLWKVLKEESKCDVRSILEKESELLSPLEKARRELASKVYYQTYLPNSWTDALFIKKLKEDKQYFQSAFTDSTPVLRNLFKTKNLAVKNFIKMLHARSPIYNEMTFKNKRPNHWAECHEKHINRVQYQTRRTMSNSLRTIRQLRKSGEIEKLAKHVEHFMGNVMTTKTWRVAPWKLEFLNEVYNTLALAYADRFVVPPFLEQKADSLEKLFHIKLSSDTSSTNPNSFNILADKKLHRMSNEIPENRKKYLERMEYRLIFAKQPIERAYIYHEVARVYYNSSHYRESEHAANKGIKEAQQNNNYLWAFLCAMLIIKTKIRSSRLEKCIDALDVAGGIACHLNCERLMDFIQCAKNFTRLKLSLVRADSISESRKSIKSKSMDSEINPEDVKFLTV